MTVTNYLGTGSVSRGRLTINNQLKTIVSKSPYLNSAADKAAVVQSIENFRTAMKGVSGLTWVRPTTSQSTSAFVDSVCPPSRETSVKGLKHVLRRFPPPLDPGTRTTGLVSPQHPPRHWKYVLTVHAGTVKMGTDDGRSGGTSVVDTNTKVYGTDNIFVVDASIFPGHITSNPTAAIMAVAEHAAVKIQALPFPAVS